MMFANGMTLGEVNKLANEVALLEDVPGIDEFKSALGDSDKLGEILTLNVRQLHNKVHRAVLDDLLCVMRCVAVASSEEMARLCTPVVEGLLERHDELTRAGRNWAGRKLTVAHHFEDDDNDFYRADYLVNSAWNMCNDPNYKFFSLAKNSKAIYKARIEWEVFICQCREAIIMAHMEKLASEVGEVKQ